MNFNNSSGGEVITIYCGVLSTENTYMYTYILHIMFLQPELNIVASFDRRGERIVTGSSKGKVPNYS